MKKILIMVICVLFFTGCTDMMNTPTKRVEEFLGKYQTMDSEVLKQLDNVIENEDSMTGEQREEYKELMKKQYQNLSYKIKDETVNGDEATVEVEIEVFDYQKALNESEDYLEKNKNKFMKEVEDAKENVEEKIEDAKDKIEEKADEITEDTILESDNNDNNNSDLPKDNTKTTSEIDQKKFMDYKIKQMTAVKDKVKYTLTMTLTKKDNKWVLDDVSEVDRLKIHGLYNY